MLFNSLDFFLFLSLVFILYWLVFGTTLRLQNLLLLFASYFFYAFWDYRFLALLLFSTLLDYFTGKQISVAKKQSVRKTWFGVSVLVNLSLLGFFKYYNFFIQGFARTFSYFGLKPDYFTLQIILPLGISFYTFHGLSYVIDIFQKRVKPANNFVDYAVFVSFFPLLIAGPIERATHLLPQIQTPRKFDYERAVDGLKQILWGIFKKIVIADTCAEFADIIFSNPTIYSGSTLILGIIFFSFQIYGDFSGYTDIALGVARLFGIEVLRNFSFPYFSRDIAEFWRRWHISLTSWFRDYVYIPLGGSRGSTMKKIRNIFIVFLLSGLWHGANWTFIAWGALNALFFLPLLLLKQHRNHLDMVAKNRLLPSIKELFQMVITFCLVGFSWIFFRAATMGEAFQYISSLFSSSLFHLPEVRPWKVMLLVICFVMIEWSGRNNHYAIQLAGSRRHWSFKWGFYYLLLAAIFIYAEKQQQFIYFQF